LKVETLLKTFQCYVYVLRGTLVVVKNELNIWPFFLFFYNRFGILIISVLFAPKNIQVIFLFLAFHESRWNRMILEWDESVSNGKKIMIRKLKKWSDSFNYYLHSPNQLSGEVCKAKCFSGVLKRKKKVKSFCWWRDSPGILVVDSLFWSHSPNFC